MNILDLVFLGLILGFTLMSLMRGAMKEILSLLGLFVGFIAANHFYQDLGRSLEGVIPDRAFSELISYLIILVLGYFFGTVLTGLSDLFASRGNDLLNRVLGGVIGFCKGTTISLVLYWVINTYIPPFQDKLAGSFMAEELAQLLSFLNTLNLI